MSLQNLEQVRAHSALSFAKSPAVMRGKDGGEAMKKIPPMIMANGLLAAIAFGIEEKKPDVPRSQGHRDIFDGIARHLASAPIGITPGVRDAKELIQHLTEADSLTLKLATAEVLEWLGYARRFVSGGGGDANDNGEDDQ